MCDQEKEDENLKLKEETFETYNGSFERNNEPKVPSIVSRVQILSSPKVQLFSSTNEEVPITARKVGFMNEQGSQHNKGRKPGRFVDKENSDESDEELWKEFVSFKAKKKREKMQKKFSDLCFSRLKSFSGGSELQIQDFFDTLEHLADCHRFGEEDLKKTLVELLAGPALIAYMSLSENQKN